MFALIAEQSVVNFPYDLTRLMQDHPAVSFSFPMSDEELVQWNIVRVYDEFPAPIVDYPTKRCNLSEPQFVDSKWVRRWEIKDMSETEKAEALAVKSLQMRSDRNNHLTASDWTQLSDAPVDTAAWATYRQELRDITAQEGFPWEVVWPEQPAN